MKKINKSSKSYEPNHSHAWRGSWNRPMYLDENALHPFTVARMTDHNVKGSDRNEHKEKKVDKV